MSARFTLGAAVTLLAGALASNSALAAYGGSSSRTGGTGNNTGGTGGTATPAPSTAKPQVPPVDHSGSIKARKDVGAATLEVSKATGALNALTATLRGPLEESAPWKNAQAAQRMAKEKVDAASYAVEQSLQKRSDYMAAKEAQTQAEKTRDTLRNDPGANSDDRVKASIAASDASQNVMKLEREAMVIDPNLTAAQAKLTESTHVMTDLQAKFDLTLKTDARWIAASQVVEDKKKALAEAQKTLTTVLASEAAAERDRQKQMAQSK